MNRLITKTALLCALAFTLSSCDKENEEPVNTEYQAKVYIKDGETANLAKVSKSVNTEGTIKRVNQIYSLKNFRQFTLGTDGKPTTTAATVYYFDFKENDATQVLGTSPLTLTATQRAMDISANTTSGYTLAYIDKSFNNVVASDKFTNLTDNKAGIALAANVIGWARYDMTTHHILPVADRTFILLKADKPYFKFKVNSIYSDEKPNKQRASDNYVFYSIDYQEFK